MTSEASLHLPEQMKAQFLDEFNKPYRLRTVALPTLTSPHDLLIKVTAASYCHTDAVLAAGQMAPFPPSLPHIGCHEFAGTVAAAYSVGDRVGVPGRSFHACGTCFECATTPSSSSSGGGGDEDDDQDDEGYSVYCSRALNNGISAPGGFREYAVVDARQIAPVPSSLSGKSSSPVSAGDDDGGLTDVETATLMCAGLTIFAALKRCQLRSGQRVGIMGYGGGLGHLGLQFAAAMHLRVLGVDTADDPLQLATKVARGATIVDARAEEAAAVLERIGKEDGKHDKAEMGLDAVIILPENQKAFDYGMALLKTHGKCVVVSFPEQGFHVSSRDIVFRNISIRGSLVGSNKTLRGMLEFAARHNVRPVVKTYPLSKLNDLVDEYRKGRGGKLAVDMTLPG